MTPPFQLPPYPYDRVAALGKLAERSADTAVLAETVQARRDLLAMTAADDPQRIGRLNDLGATLQASFQQNGDVSSLAEAIAIGRAVIAIAAEPSQC